MPNLRTIGWLILAAHLGAPQGWAANGGRITLPLTGVTQRKTSGLQLEIYTHWVDSSGYRPVNVTVSSLTPNVTDRYLRIRLVPQDWYGSRQGVEFQLKLPEGATSASKEVAVPSLSIWNQFKVTTEEGGQQLDDLSATVGLNRTSTSYNWTEAYPSLMFIDTDAPQPDRINSLVAGAGGSQGQSLPDILAVAQLFAPLDDYAQSVWQNQAGRRDGDGRRIRSDDGEILATVQRLQNVQLLPPSELPTQWLNYTALDLIFISWENLRATLRQRPEAWQAIRQYVRAGGNLLVHGVGDDFGGLRELDALLDVPSLPTSVAQGATVVEGWHALRESTFGSDLWEISTPANTVRSFNQNRMIVQEELADEDEAAGEANLRDTTTIPQSRFRWRPAGWGLVMALSPDELSDVSSDEWGWLLNDIGVDRWRWYRRHGLSRQRPNPGFWEFLIPGVGAAPVRAFLIVITAFVFLIGPVNYFLLQRSRRLYLLLVTVPLGSALFIGSLFGFALLKDGLGTRARLRSFSQVLPSGQVVSWSRQSYYAALAPSSGLTYPTDAAVYAIDFDPSRRLRTRRITQWRDVQQLAPGYLNPRTTSQYLVVYPAAADSPVQIERPADGPPQVNNATSVPIDHLLIVDEDQAFWITNLAPAAKGTAERVSLGEAKDRYAGILRTHRPDIPSGFTAPRERNSYRYYYNNFDTGFSVPDQQSSLLEAALRWPTSLPSPAGRFFYAITSKAPEFVPIGVAGCRQEAGFHVIHGTW